MFERIPAVCLGSYRDVFGSSRDVWKGARGVFVRSTEFFGLPAACLRVPIGFLGDTSSISKYTHSIFKTIPAVCL